MRPSFITGAYFLPQLLVISANNNIINELRIFFLFIVVKVFDYLTTNNAPYFHKKESLYIFATYKYQKTLEMKKIIFLILVMLTLSANAQKKTAAEILKEYKVLFLIICLMK